MATSILTQDYMDAIDEKHNVVFRDNQYTVIHLLTLDIIDLLRLAAKQTLSNDQLYAGLDACLEIRKILDDANAEKVKKYVEHKDINESK